jgi:hypothetical protein
MLHEKVPHYCCGAHLIDCTASDQFRYVFAPWPGMASAFNRIQHHVRVLSAVRVGKTVDAWSNARVNGAPDAFVSLRQARRPFLNICKWKRGYG